VIEMIDKLISHVPWQTKPFPSNPSSHTQWNVPMALTHVAYWLQPPFSFKHSFTS